MLRRTGISPIRGQLVECDRRFGLGLDELEAGGRLRDAGPVLLHWRHPASRDALGGRHRRLGGHIERGLRKANSFLCGEGVEVGDGNVAAQVDPRSVEAARRESLLAVGQPDACRTLAAKLKDLAELDGLRAGAALGPLAHEGELRVGKECGLSAHAACNSHIEGGGAQAWICRQRFLDSLVEGERCISCRHRLVNRMLGRRLSCRLGSTRGRLCKQHGRPKDEILEMHE